VAPESPGDPSPTAGRGSPAPEISPAQTRITTGIEDAVAAARAAAGDKDVALIGRRVVTEALTAGLVDELILHQVPVLLGGGRRFSRTSPTRTPAVAGGSAGTPE
jgi:dihydrofolate reductase